MHANVRRTERARAKPSGKGANMAGVVVGGSGIVPAVYGPPVGEIGDFARAKAMQSDPSYRRNPR